MAVNASQSKRRHQKEEARLGKPGFSHYPECARGNAIPGGEEENSAKRGQPRINWS